MILGFGIFRSLVVQTIRETLRQPVLVLATTVTVLLAALMPFLTAFQFGESIRLVRDGVLALQFSVGAYLAAAISQLGMGTDLHGRAAGLILCKPVGRLEFFLARYTGALVVVGLFSLSLWAAAVVSMRISPFEYGMDPRAGFLVLIAVGAAHGVAGLINYRTGIPYAEWAFYLLPVNLVLSFLLLLFRDLQGANVSSRMLILESTRLIPACGLVFLGLAVVSAAAHALAARFGSAPVLAGGVVFLLVAGLSFEPLMNEWKGEVGEGSRWVWGVGLLPSWSLFWPADLLGSGQGFPLSYLGWAALYAVGWSVAFLAAGAAWFEGRELG